MGQRASRATRWGVQAGFAVFATIAFPPGCGVIETPILLFGAYRTKDLALRCSGRRDLLFSVLLLGRCRPRRLCAALHYSTLIYANRYLYNPEVYGANLGTSRYLFSSSI